MRVSDPEEPDLIVETWLARRTDEIIRRYRRKHGLEAGSDVTTAMVRTHFYTERRLAREILMAEPARRAAVAEKAYTEFYARCFWLDAYRMADTDRDEHLSFGPIERIARRFGTAVYEVGSGNGRLAAYLARHGFDCVATDISLERKRHAARDRDGLLWHGSDGVNLARFEPASQYDLVLSSQLIEHLHPDDLHAHCANAHAILKPGGAYMFNTPHRYSGPEDISEIFGMTRSQCFHLREYTYTELAAALRAAGFSKLQAVYVAPKRLRARVRLADRPVVSSLYLHLVRTAESALAHLPVRVRKRLLRAAYLVGLWRREVFIVAIK